MKQTTVLKCIVWLAMACGGVETQPPTVTVTYIGDGAGQVTSSAGEIDCKGSCEVELERALTIVLTATAEKGSRFVGWDGECTSSGNTCEVEAGGERSVMAMFERIRSVVVVDIEGVGDGTVVSNPIGMDCQEDCEDSLPIGTVTLTAVPKGESEFLGWSAPCGQEPVCTFALDERTPGEPMLLIAQFEKCIAQPTILPDKKGEFETIIEVPTYCHSATIKAWGAGGGVGVAPGGGGGFASARLSVTPGEELTVYIGQAPQFLKSSSRRSGAGGGGSAVVRGQTPLVVAGGGGGGGAGFVGSGGSGGGGGGGAGGRGQDGVGRNAFNGGQGGTTKSRGLGGNGVHANGESGKKTHGGAGAPGPGGGDIGGLGFGNGGDGGKSDNSGGGGGGGYFGGGGGGSGGLDTAKHSTFGGGGGGGGSSYAAASGTNIVVSQGSSPEPANIDDDDYADQAGLGGRGTDLDRKPAKPGRVVILWETR